MIEKNRSISNKMTMWLTRGHHTFIVSSYIPNETFYIFCERIISLILQDIYVDRFTKRTI